MAEEGGARPVQGPARVTLIALAVLAVVLVCFVAYPFAGAILFAAVLAGSVAGPVERLARRLGGRPIVAATLATAAVALLIVLPVALLVGFVTREAVDAVTYVRETLRGGGLPALIDDLPPSLRGLAEQLRQRLMPGGESQIGELAGAHTGDVAGAVGGVLVATWGVVLQVTLMLIALYFFLVDGRRLVAWLAGVAPIGRSRTYELLADFRTVSEAVVLSSLATAGVQATVAFAGYLIVGVPQPVFFALVTFFVAFIPAVGAASVGIVLSLLLLLTGSTTAAFVLAGWSAGPVALSDNIVKPWLMKGRMEIHGAVIFFALIGGLAAFGPVGLLAGPLIISFFLAVVRMCQRDLANASEARLRAG